MHTMQGLLWEQWRQSRLWIVGTCAFLAMLIAAVALYRPWLLAQFHGDTFPLDKFAWAIGFTLIGMLFVDQRMRDVSLYFPGRLFALPCRTLPLVASQLLYKSAIAILLGTLIALYHWMLLDQARPSALAVLLFLAMVAVSQALVLLATIASAWTAVGAGGLWLGAVLGTVYALQEFLDLSESGASAVAASASTALGWGLALAWGPAARHGVGERCKTFLTYENRTISVRLPQPIRFQWDFTSPAWAHTWYEWRRVTVWTVRVVVPASGVLTLLALWGVNEDLALLSVYGIALAAASSCSYFLLRVSPSERRFLLAQPRGEAALVNGKLLAALFASLGGTLLSACVMLLLCLLAILFGQVRMGSEVLGGVAVLSIYMAGLLWIGLTSAPIYLLAFMAGSILAFCLTAPISLALGLGVNEFLVAAVSCTVVALLLYAAWRGLRARGIPIPWELSLALLALAPAYFELIRRYIHVESPFTLRPDEQVSLLLPLFLLFGALLFARRIGLISRVRAMTTLAGHALFSVAFLALYLAGFQMGPLTELDTVFWWIAACFAPLIWVPLSLRMQYYR